MTGLMTPDKTSVYSTDTIAKVQRRLYKTCNTAPRRTAFVVAFSLVKAVVLLGWILSRQRAGVVTVPPRDLSQSQASILPTTH